MKQLMTMRAALEHPQIFGLILPGESWAKWRVLLVAIMGEALNDVERVIFKELTGREREPGKRVDEFNGIFGRRSGKTRAMAILASYTAALCDFSDGLAPGERAVFPIISASLWQAGKAFQYLDGIFSGVPMLRKLVTGQTADTISLSTRVDIECRPASFRTIRGGSLCGIIADENAFWRSDNSANPDVEILNAARPGLATTGGILAMITSPYAKKGEAYVGFKRDFGPNGDPSILVAKAASKVMNPGLPQAFIDRAYERDASVAAAELGGDFRNDVESLIPQEVVEACVEPGVFERPPVLTIDRNGFMPDYKVFCDMSSGSSTDSAAIAVAHLEGDIAVLDCVREIRPTFNPSSAADEFVEVMKRYQAHEVVGDRWATGFVAEAFTQRGKSYKASELTKSELYSELVPQLNSGRCELLDNKRLITQLCALERRTTRAGRDSIDRPQNVPEDLANAAAGALYLASGNSGGFDLATYIKAYS